MQGKQFNAADARVIVQRIVASVPAGFERDALLILAGETLREASDWLHGEPDREGRISQITPALKRRTEPVLEARRRA